ncbi:MAG: hypothetical protein WCJ18_11305 [Planctomycetota bacterium]
MPREPSPSMVVILNLAATAVMTGVIWYVQLVHYPLMAGWPHDDFGRWEALHRERTGLIVVPVMLVEGATAALLLARRPAGLPAGLPWLAAALLLGVWASTFLLQVPCHQRLAAGWDEGVHARLVETNWLRTGLWTARFLLVGVMAAAVAAGRGSRG